MKVTAMESARRRLHHRARAVQTGAEQRSRSKIVVSEHLKRLKEDWEGLSCADRIIYILELPFEYLRRYTIPCCEPEKYDKYVAIFIPALSPLAFMWYYYSEDGMMDFLEKTTYFDMKVTWVILI